MKTVGLPIKTDREILISAKCKLCRVTMFVINSTPKRKFRADSLRIIVGLETHRLREESAFVFRGPPLRLVRPFRRPHDRWPRYTWKSSTICLGPCHFYPTRFTIVDYRGKTDLCKRSSCSEQTVLWGVAMV